MSKKFNKMPADVLNIKNSYTAYCLNEASMILLTAFENNEQIYFSEEKTKKHYDSFSDFYRQFD